MAAMIVQSASTPATSSVSKPNQSPAPRLVSASVRSTSLSYIPVAEDPDSAQRLSPSENPLHIVVGVPATKPKCCRKLIHKFEKEARKHEMAVTRNPAKLTRRAPNVSVFERLSDHRPSKPPLHDKNLTFCPKLNPLSIRLAQERSEKLEEIQSKAASSSNGTTKDSKLVSVDCTFKPVMSERSLQLAQNIESCFLTRQQLHLEKKQKYIDDSLNMLYSRTSRPKPPHVKQHVPVVDTSNTTAIQSSTNSSPPSQILATTNRNQQRLISMNCKESLESPSKRIKRHSRGHTVPLLPVNRHHSDDSMSRTTKPKIIATVKQPSSNEKKTPPTVMPDLGNNISAAATSESLMQKEFKKLSEFDKAKRIRIMAEKVSRAKKVFSVKGGYKTIRRALRNRGWVEAEYYLNKSTKDSITVKGGRTRNTNGGIKSTDCCSDSSDDDSDDDDNLNDDPDDDPDDIEESDSEEEREDEEEYTLLSRALRHVDPSFIWTLRRNHMTPSYLKKDQIYNHFSRAMFTTKCGLQTILHYLSSFAPVDRHTFFPRCYELTSNEDREAFIDDYRLTAAMNIVKLVACEINSQFAGLYEPSDKWSIPRVNVTYSIPSATDDNRVATPTPPQPSTSTHSLQHSTAPSQTSLSAPATPVKQSHTRSPSRLHPQSASSLRNLQVVPEECVLLAIRACEVFIRSKENNDIDQSQIDLCPKLTEVEWTTLLSQYYSLVFSDGVLFCNPDTAMRAEEVLEQVSFYHPQLSMDGIKNLWILKPGSMSRGRGIVCKDHLEDILNFVKPSLVGQWVVQKYIERPLLIHNTKFDIRQWFLVTDWNPLTMWMYKRSYLRFSSQVYSTQNLDRSIHLCNNSIQKHIAIGKTRSNELPTENMWSNESFIDFLRERGETDKWDSVIYPNMVEAIKCVLLVSQDFIEDRKNTFELFGADFMITTDYIPWLIEINSSPTMERNTAVTKKMCKEVMEDTIKVVVDRRSNKNADTGNFELAFKQAKLEVRQYVGMNLCVEGASMEKKSKGAGYNIKTRQLNMAAVDLGKSFNFDSFRRSP